MRCTHCVLPEQTPNITFDAAGECNYCQSYRPFTYKGEAALRERLDAFRNPAAPYDCLVAISGGRDSSYVLLKLVKDYGMRVLAVNYENPFTVPQARRNIENAIAHLDVDLVQFRHGDRRHVRILRRAVQAWFAHPLPQLIPMICLGCKTAWVPIFRTAQQHGIRCVVSGGNPYELISFKREMVGISRDEDPTRAFYKYIYIVRDLLRHPAYLHPTLLAAMARSYLFGNPHALGLRWLRRGISWVELFHYVRWDEQEILHRLQTELDWDYPHELQSSWRFDCRVKHLLDLMYLGTLGMTDKDDFYAKLVREGGMIRDDAVQRLAVENVVHLDEVETLLAQAGFDDTAFLNTLEERAIEHV